MAQPPFFKRLKRSLFPAKYELREIHSELRKIRTEILEKLLIEQKRNALTLKPLYQYHVSNLEHQAEFQSESLVNGHALERVARRLKLKIIGEDFSKPTLGMFQIGEAFAKAVEVGTRTKMVYCKRYGYNLAILEELPRDFQRPLSWLKVPLMFRLMKQGYQQVFYLDADSLITNPEVRLEPFFARLQQANRHMMIAEDLNNLNMGSFFMLNTWQSLALLDLIYETDAEINHGWWEQKALIDLVESNPIIKKLLSIEFNARLFNSMLFDTADYPDYTWQPGDFICHCAGNRGLRELSSKMNEIYQQIPGRL